MAAPTYRCPFKQNAGVGLTCEATTCGAYDKDVEQCTIILNARIVLKVVGYALPNNV